MKEIDPRCYPDEAYSESENMTYRVQASLGGDSLKIWPATLVIGLAILFLLIDPRVSAVVIPLSIIGLIVVLVRFHVACTRLKLQCPDCGILLVREEHVGDEYFVCHKCCRFGRGRCS